MLTSCISLWHRLDLKTHQRKGKQRLCAHTRYMPLLEETEAAIICESSTFSYPCVNIIQTSQIAHLLICRVLYQYIVIKNTWQFSKFCRRDTDCGYVTSCIWMLSLLNTSTSTSTSYTNTSKYTDCLIVLPDNRFTHCSCYRMTKACTDIRITSSCVYSLSVSFFYLKM